MTSAAGSGVWTEIQIELPAEAAEIVSAELADVTDGIEIRDEGTLVPAAPGRTTLVALSSEDGVAAVLQVLEATIERSRENGLAVDPVSVRRRQAHEDEWRDVWKQYFRATRIGRRFVVRPSWDPGTVGGDDAVIDLDPGRAFGTGAHPSTRLVIAMAETLADAHAPVRRFLDLGCGSGILTIAAARLWPRAEGWAVDNDPEACACTAENLQRNRVDSVTIVTGTLTSVAPGTCFDVVLANIQAEVLEPLAPALGAYLQAGAHVLLSGLLLEQGEGIARAFADAGFTLRERREEGEWCGLCVQAA